MREINKVWVAIGKFIKAQCDNGKCVDLPLAGKFKKVFGVGDKYMFVPHLSLVSSANFSFPENEFNISPF